MSAVLIELSEETVPEATDITTIATMTAKLSLMVIALILHLSLAYGA